MDGITAGQIRSARLWETTERKNTALVQVLKQACARNKAIEKKQLWVQKDKEDYGSSTCISLKSNDGEVVRTITTIPKQAQVTDNSTNKYAEERARLADLKEDVQLERFCDGNDCAWRPDTFFTETCGHEDVPPWPIRPTELFTNPHLVMRIMAQQMEQKREKKKEKKLQKEERKKQKEAGKAARKEKKAKKEKKGKKERKEKKRKGKKAKEKKGKKEKRATSTKQGRPEAQKRKRRRAGQGAESVDSECEAVRKAGGAEPQDAPAGSAPSPGAKVGGGAASGSSSSSSSSSGDSAGAAAPAAAGGAAGSAPSAPRGPEEAVEPSSSSSASHEEPDWD